MENKLRFHEKTLSILLSVFLIGGVIFVLVIYLVQNDLNKEIETNQTQIQLENTKKQKTKEISKYLEEKDSNNTFLNETVLRTNKDSDSLKVFDNAINQHLKSELTYPDVYRLREMTNVSLQEDQQNNLDLVESQFNQAIGTTPRWDGDPEYTERWITAKKMADERFRGIMGEQVTRLMRDKMNQEEIHGTNE